MAIAGSHGIGAVVIELTARAGQCLLKDV
jgi:hypothetical protein